MAGLQQPILIPPANPANVNAIPVAAQPGAAAHGVAGHLAAAGNPVAGIPGAPLTLPVKPRTFMQFYSDASKDPCGGDYTHIMQRFDPTSDTTVAAEVLLEQALGSGNTMNQAYLCCSALRRGARIYCIHLPMKYTSVWMEEPPRGILASMLSWVMSRRM